MPREEFDMDLRAIRGTLVDMTMTAAVAVDKATTALLERDLTAVNAVREIDRRLDWTSREVDRRTYQLLALQAPVARDLRELVSAIKIGADIRRMGSLAHHIAKVAELRYPDRAIPDDLLPIFGKMGAVAARIAAGAAASLETQDTVDASRLAVDDDAMDGLRRALFRRLLSDWPHGVESAIDVALVGRYYERFADHAVAIAQVLVYLVTGRVSEERAEPLR
jgi:phosphate transport system protein